MTLPNCKTRRLGRSFVRKWVAKSSISGQISFSSTLGKGLNLLQGRLSCLWRSAHVALQSLSLCTKQPKGWTRPEQWLRKTQTLQLGWLPKNHCMRIPFTQTNLVQNLTLDLIASISGCVEEKWRELWRPDRRLLPVTWDCCYPIHGLGKNFIGWVTERHRNQLVTNPTKLIFKKIPS